MIFNQELICENNSTCTVTLQTRKECSKCRLSKCYAVGMRMELVAPNEEQRIRRGRSTNVDRLTARTQSILGTTNEVQPFSSTSSDWTDTQFQNEVWSPKTTSVYLVHGSIERFEWLGFPFPHFILSLFSLDFHLVLQTDKIFLSDIRTLSEWETIYPNVFIRVNFVIFSKLNFEFLPF